MQYMVRFLPDGAGGFVGKCSQHAGWTFRSNTLTDDDLQRASVSMKRHASRQSSVVFEFIGCLPGGVV